MFTGNVYLSGLEGANQSALATSGADAMCIKADRTPDLTNAVCSTEGLDNLGGISALAPADAPVSWAAEGNPWPMPEITDAPTF